jgi:aryl-alcohol dehydrogenase-like predicted oxidoreductase
MLVEEGKVLYIGCSNFAGWQLARAIEYQRVRQHSQMLSAQNHYSLLNRSIESDLAPACIEYGVSIIPYYPLASGLLTGKYQAGGATGRIAERRVQCTAGEAQALDRYAEIARDLDVSLGQLALIWLRSKPSVGTIPVGATTPRQVRENAAADARSVPQEAIDQLGAAMKAAGNKHLWEL